MVFNPWWTKMTWNPSVFFQLVFEKNGLRLEVDILENYGIGSETDVSLVDQDDLNWSSSTLGMTWWSSTLGTPRCSSHLGPSRTRRSHYQFHNSQGYLPPDSARSSRAPVEKKNWKKIEKPTSQSWVPRPSTTSVFVTIVLTSKWTGVFTSESSSLSFNF